VSEFALIQKYFMRRSKRSDVLHGVGDDAAVLRVPPDRRLVAAVDTIVEGVHFPVGTDADAIGHRALAVNLSDIAAMGAEPAWATLSLSLPERNESWLLKFADAFHSLADRFHVSLVGGDTVRGPLSVTVSIMGLVEGDRWLTRSGAKPGDTLFVSGIPGEAAAGLAVIQRGMAASSAGSELQQCFLWPEPRIALGRTLRMLASAAIDVSDGVLADLEHICTSSGCGARIDVESLPVSKSAEALFDPKERERLALSGGDDYELLFTVSPERMLDVEAAIAGGVKCTPIGRMIEDRGLVCYRDGQPFEIEHRGYNHFS
jgi:thiamine-monophosphate kinase